MTPEQIAKELNDIELDAQCLALQQAQLITRVTSLKEKLGVISSPAPSKGLTEQQRAKLRQNRLRDIYKKQQKNAS